MRRCFFNQCGYCSQPNKYGIISCERLPSLASSSSEQKLEKDPILPDHYPEGSPCHYNLPRLLELVKVEN